jgi:2-keto-4-pentenoate hydratase/2-oxohepta-3-ene-1,7-dioic acid hydratase in catechol pathway
MNFPLNIYPVSCHALYFRALAAEQNNPIPKSPIVFLKPTTSYIEEGEAIQVHYCIYMPIHS